MTNAGEATTPGGGASATQAQQLHDLIEAAAALAHDSVTSYAAHAQRMVGLYTGAVTDGSTLIDEVIGAGVTIASEASKAVSLWMQALRIAAGDDSGP